MTVPNKSNTRKTSSQHHTRSLSATAAFCSPVVTVRENKVDISTVNEEAYSTSPLSTSQNQNLIPSSLSPAKHARSPSSPHLKSTISPPSSPPPTPPYHEAMTPPSASSVSSFPVFNGSTSTTTTTASAGKLELSIKV